MASKQSRVPQTPSSAHHNSKLPRFLQKQARDRSKSVNDGSASADNSIGSSSSSANTSSIVESSSSSASKPRSDRRSSKLKNVGVLKELKDDRIGHLSEVDTQQRRDPGDESMEETPVIVEPILAPARSRSRADRPLSASSSDSHPAVSYYPSSHSTQRLSDMGTRLSGWFSHTFSTSSTDLSLPAILTNSSPISASPKTKTAGVGLLTAARHGKGHLDKAVRYLLDSDATPDKCTDPIWLLGVQHPGYEPPSPQIPSGQPASGRRSSLDMRRSTSSYRNSTSSSRGATSSPEPSMSFAQQQANKQPGAHWPPVFYADFTSRIWLTYRSHFAPIRDQSLTQLEAEACGQAPQPAISASPRKWNWPGSGERGWTSDAGWGCMLRTGQSLLANSLIHLHLGRDWRRPPHPVHTSDYATYVRILTWFFDSTDPACPFSVHRMALAGKDLGKDVGQWFGPSTAAGAIKTLVHAFSEAGLGVSVATDGVVYETDVLAASNASPYYFRHGHRSGASSPSTRRRHSVAPHQQGISSIWGQRPVLVLIGVRLGIDCVNPIYYDAVKFLYTFPQSVGIAGGRPSSSYYFVGSQADSLFYLDPHHARPAVPFRPPPRPSNASNTSNNTDSPPTSYRETQQSPMAGSSPARMQPSPSGSSFASQMSPPSSHHHSASVQSLQSVGLDATQEHYVNAYSPTELRTFHCEKVRKMPLSGLDPSMLIGFLCRNERDWRDLREKVAEMGRKYKAIFSIQDEPPSWPSDSDDMGLESVSDVDIDIEGPSDAFDGLQDPEGAEAEGVEGEDNILDEDESDGRDRKRYSTNRGRQSEDVMTEEDPVDPVTPGPSTTTHEHAFDQAQHKQNQVREIAFKSHEEDLLGDDEEWVETSDPPLLTPQPQNTSLFIPSAVPLANALSNASTATTASYVSASSSYSNSDSQHPNGSGSRNGSVTRVSDRERERDSSRDGKGKRSESVRTSKVKASKSSSSANKRDHTPAQQEYYPFPVVDDREPDEVEYNELSSQSDSSWTGHQRQRTGTASSRTPVASVTLANSNSNGGPTGGSRLRNTRARDGGRTQSGGVRGIVTSDLEDSSDF